MRIIRIKTNKIGGHSCMTVTKLSNLPIGWAVLPNDLPTPNFPYGNIVVETRCGVPTVIGWTPKPIPEQTVTFTPSLEDDMQSMIVEQAFHLTMLELEVENALQNT